MATAKHIGHIGALAVARRVGNVRRTATRMTASIGAAALVVTAMVVPVPASTTSPAVRLAASTACTGTTEMRCALLMGGTTGPTLNDADVEGVMSRFIVPTHPDQTIQPIKVTTPEEFWPITGLLRLAGLAVGDPRFFGPGGAAWPDEPWWKLSGLFDLTFDQSVRAGVADLETAMADSGNDHLVILGYSQGAAVAIREKQRLAEQYPAGTTPPDIDFVLGGDPNLPNGGLEARFPGLYIPILNWTFKPPEPTDTPFDTVVVTRQYDGIADFPLYPIDFIADLNAILGFFYVHTNGFDVSLADDASAPTVSTDPTGKTTYYFFENPDLPLFGPLRTLGVPEPVIDVVEPFFREVVELGYDRSIQPWKPTPARLIPKLDPVTVAGDFVDAIKKGIDNAGALVEPPAPLTTRAASTNTDVNEAAQEAEKQTNESIGAVQSVDNGRTTPRSTGRTSDSTPFTAGDARQTPLRDAVKKLSNDIKKAVADVSDTIKKATSVGKHDDIKGAPTNRPGGV